MPRVLLLDEPLSNLDARLRLQTREELKRIQQKTKITTIFVTHDQEEAMSISDMIIVMQSGVIQQIGRPQEVYDQPVNMFVAKFLGTPPINMFTGSVRGGRLFIGENDVLPAPGTPDGEYNIGIRPEGFIPEENGPLCCAFGRVEVMGRDTSVIFSHPAAEADTVRAIISSANKPDGASGKIRFALRPDKVFLFDKTDGKRIAFRAE
jgi:multiple sugar transport system ATP-binding protein